ncbi:MAG: UDP-N-acetylmuramate--L-alanine ligase [Parasporobacterium sp.]|nr:UDP-N-acetylmuramate--L-alanine ligase [Parasporobacterium sp.]
MNKLDFTNSNQKIHFIGIGGISMSGLAQILLKNGFSVSGSDSKKSALTDELEAQGAKIFIGQRAGNITDDIDLVVYTSAISEDNPELQAAKDAGIDTMVRADFLGALMKNYPQAVCISGTHGKTTTTSLLSQIMVEAETDPTISVGGVLPIIGGNVRIGGSDLFITEACEYTNSFLSFFPTIAVVLNVQSDHLDFFKDLEDIRNSFRRFTHLLPEDGTLIINGEIDNLSFFTEGLSAKVLTFGLNGDFDFTAKNISYDKFACAEYDLYQNGSFAAHVKLNLTGEHNVYNSISALAVAVQLGIPVEKAAASIGNFTGVNRRFQLKGEIAGVTIIDDYAHHPDEIRATLTAARNYPHDRLVVVFQPHTYTRTKAFLEEFADALSLADSVVLAEIYAARETDTLGISSADLQKLIQEKETDCYFFKTFDEIENFLLENCVNGDLLITMGAGDVYIIGEKLLGQ